jgi:hypothetical protein
MFRCAQGKSRGIGSRKRAMPRTPFPLIGTTVEVVGVRASINRAGDIRGEGDSGAHQPARIRLRRRAVAALKSQIEAWAKQQPDYSSRSEAIRRLVELRLATKGETAAGGLDGGGPWLAEHAAQFDQAAESAYVKARLSLTWPAWPRPACGQSGVDPRAQMRMACRPRQHGA